LYALIEIKICGKSSLLILDQIQYQVASFFNLFIQRSEAENLKHNQKNRSDKRIPWIAAEKICNTLHYCLTKRKFWCTTNLQLTRPIY